jgi:hypothetical protein
VDSQAKPVLGGGKEGNMASGTSKSRLDTAAALEVKVKLSVQLLVGSAAAAMTYLMYRCMESCSALLQTMHHYH